MSKTFSVRIREDESQDEIDQKIGYLKARIEKYQQQDPLEVEIDLVTEKLLVAIFCTNMKIESLEDKLEFEERVNSINFCGSSARWRFPDAEQWEEYIQIHPQLKKGQENGIPCQKKPKTHKHYVMFS